ncbi:hypothetical protein SeLEV6574_g01132 [Synchytrium endobioticum]|nr:hypothetical protein SeLEV6574_g01132 [Synchytrium endobioticum]
MAGPSSAMSMSANFFSSTLQTIPDIPIPETAVRERKLWSKTFPVVPHEIMNITDRNFKLSSLPPPITLKRKEDRDHSLDGEISDSAATDKKDGIVHVKDEKSNPSSAPKAKTDGEAFDASRVASLGRAVAARQQRFKRRTQEFSAEDERKWQQRRIERAEAKPWILSSADATPQEELSGTIDGDHDAVYWLLFERADGFEVVPVDKWYKFVPPPQYETKDIETAEREFAEGRGSSVAKDRQKQSKIMAKIEGQASNKMSSEQLAEIERMRQNRFTVVRDADRVVFSGPKGLNVRQQKRRGDEEDDTLDFDSNPFEDDGTEDLGVEMDEQDRKELDRQMKSEQRKATKAWKELVDHEVEDDEDEADVAKRRGQIADSSKSLKRRLRQAGGQTAMKWDEYGSDESEETDDDEDEEFGDQSTSKDAYKPMLGQKLKSLQKTTTPRRASSSPSPPSRECSAELKHGQKISIKMTEDTPSVASPPNLKRGRSESTGPGSVKRTKKAAVASDQPSSASPTPPPPQRGPMEHPAPPTWQEVLQQRRADRKQKAGESRPSSPANSVGDRGGSADPLVKGRSAPMPGLQRPTGIRHVSPPRPLPPNHPQLIAANSNTSSSSSSNNLSPTVPITLKRSSTPSTSSRGEGPPSKRIKHVSPSPFEPSPPPSMPVPHRPATPHASVRPAPSKPAARAASPTPGATLPTPSLAVRPETPTLSDSVDSSITEAQVLEAARRLGDNLTVKTLVHALRPLMGNNEKSKALLRDLVKKLFHTKDGKLTMKAEYAGSS